MSIATAVGLLWSMTMVAGAAAQDVSGALTGRFTTESGAPLPQVEVEIAGPGLLRPRITSSDQRGTVHLLSLPAGMYALRVRHIGYRPVRIEAVQIRLGRTTSLGDVSLAEQPVELEEVVVSARGALVDPTTTTVGATLGAETYDVLPVERDARVLATLLPQANGSYLGDEVNFAGSTGFENHYFIDGTDVTDPFRARTGTVLPYNFVKEVEVRTGGYEAEYRSSLGGIVNVVTYSGGDAFEGQVFGFLTANQFAGDARQGVAEPQKGDFTRYDLGVRVGGPIRRGQAWFVAAYSPAVVHEDVSLPGVGFSSDRSTSHSFATKLTWQAGSRTDLALTVLGDPTSRDGVGATLFNYAVATGFANPDPSLGDLASGGVTASLRARHFAGDHLVLESSLSRLSREEEYRPRPSGITGELVIDRPTGVWSGGYPERVDYHSVRLAANAGATLQLGRHTLKGGAEYVDNRLDQDLQAGALFLNGDGTFLRFVQVGRGTVHHRMPSFYAQDSWQVHDRVRLNAGLRWDGQYLIGSDGHIAQEIQGEFQPRIGIIYSAGSGRAQKLFGSYGRFSQELSTYVSSFHYTDPSYSVFTAYSQDPRVTPTPGQPFVLEPSRKSIPGLRGQAYDEWTLGYERQVGSAMKVGIRGIIRNLHQAIEDAFDTTAGGRLTLGNPGRRELAGFPRARRRYQALELSLEYAAGRRLRALASYVLSRNYGNYGGLFTAEFGTGLPNAYLPFDVPDILANSTGLLPNDRPQVLKFAGSYAVAGRLTAGTIFLWETGTPLNEFGSTIYGYPYASFLQKRGTAGRTPAIADWNLRLAWDLSGVTGARWRPTVLLDLFHIGSARRPVNIDQEHYLGPLDADGNEANPNPTYLRPTRYAPPMSARLGLVADF
jgi:hypothetical protein